MATRNYETYLPLIKQTVNKFCKNNKYINIFTTKEDLVQDMYFVFDECEKIFDPKRGVPFEAFLCKRCRFELSKTCRKNRRLLDIDDIDDHENDFSENCAMENYQNIENLKDALEYIKDDENSEILTDYFIKKIKQCDLAQKYCTNITKINRIIQEFRQDIKEIYSEI